MGRRAPAVGEPLAEPAVVQARARIVIVDPEHQLARNMPLPFQRRVHRRLEGLVQPGRGRRTAAPHPVLAVVAVGDVVLIIHAVGDVDVDIEVGPVLQDQAAHGLHLDLIQFHVVAVQVLVGRGVTPALGARPALVRPRIGARPLMPIHRQDRHQDQIDPVQEAVLAIKGDVAQQHHAGVLAIDLTRMNAGLGQDHRLGRIEGRAVLGRDHGVDLAPLGRDAERLDADQVRGLIQPVEPGPRVGVGRAEVQIGVTLEVRRPAIAGLAQQRAAGPVPGGRRR